MIRKYFICSTFILAFITFIRPVHADIALNDSSISLAKGEVIAKKVEKNHAYIKLAGARWILDEEEDQDALVFEKDNLFPEITANCKSVKNGMGKKFSYIQKCSACQEGYELNADGICAEKKCEGYNSPTEEIEGCEVVEPCQKGKNFVYKCETCLTGYKITDKYLCQVDDCENYPLDAREDVNNCKEAPISCNKGQHVYYGCPEDKCDAGFKWKKGFCDTITCGADFSLDSCPKNGNCELCQSGRYYKKYKLNSCSSGYMVKDNSCVKTSGALAFTMATKQNTQEVVLSVQGECTIDWGDGIVENHNTGENIGNDVSHVYKTPGNYNVRITGEPTGVSIKSGREYITDVSDTSLSTINKYDDIFSND